MSAAGGEAHRLALANGVPVVVRTRPGCAVTTVSTWVLSGSRHETQPGISHLAEHVLLQACPRGRAASAVDHVERLGGEVNAVTSKEYLALYARVPSADADGALAALVESMVGEVVDREVVEAERRVVEEELRLAESDVSDVVHDMFYAIAFPDDPLGRPVGGTVDAVASLTVDDLATWARATVHGGRVAALVDGDVAPEGVLALLEAGPLGALPAGEPAGREGPGPAIAAGRRDQRGKSDTVSVIVGGPGFRYDDRRGLLAEVVMELLAGANTSVLQEEIRSRRGLSYDVWGMATGHSDTGVWRVGMSTAPEHRDEVVKLACDLIRDAVDRGFGQEQVDLAARRVAGLLLLDAESTVDESLQLGKHGLVGDDPLWTVSARVRALREIDAADVRACAREMVARLVVATVGGSPEPDEHRTGQRTERW